MRLQADIFRYKCCRKITSKLPSKMRDVIVSNIICQHCPVDLPMAGLPTSSKRNSSDPIEDENNKIFCFSLPSHEYHCPYQTHWTLQHLPKSKPTIGGATRCWLDPGVMVRNWKPSISKRSNGPYILIETGQNSKPNCVYIKIYIYIHFFFQKRYTVHLELHVRSSIA